MQVVILCGGEGARLLPKTEKIPKPLIPVGGKPILWHIMKIYSQHGHKDFILCLGYLGNKIKEYFQNSENIEKDWNITFVDTGLKGNKGERLKKVKDWIKTNEKKIVIKDYWENGREYSEEILYPLSGLFVQELIEKYGTEKFLEFFKNQTYENAKLVYGNELDSLIKEFENKLNS